MYQWLLGAVSALFAAARRPAPPPAPPPRKRPPPSTWLPVEDVGEAQPKKHKSDYTTSEHKRKDEEVSAGVTPPAKTARKHHNASVVDASPVTKAAEETRSTASDPSSERPAGSVPDVEMLQAMEREVSAAFGRGEADEVLSSAYKLRVTREDIGTLENFCWLNDEVINFYMNLLMERSKKEGYPSVHVFSTFFYPKLISGGHKAVGRWTKAVDIFKQDLIFVPIHLSMHWTLGVIDVRRKSIRYLDSLGQKGNKICETLFKYLQEESRQKRNLDLAASEWTLFSTEPHEIPQQQNGSDCGVFMCKYADYISRDKPMAFTQNHMPYFRKRMVWEILHQQLL
ncbi:sentrin-specific protease 2 [Aegotheles albertisi]